MSKATITHCGNFTVPALCLAGLMLCSASWAGTLQGTAMYRERIALPPDAVFEAELQDISRADAPAVVLGRARLEPAGQTPFHFKITYDDAAVQTGHRYAVRAIVMHGKQLLFTTDRVYPVLDGSDKPLEMLLVSARAASSAAQGPSFDCTKAETGSIEAMVCANAELSALDRKMAAVYAEARKKAANEHPPFLKAEQRGWIKGRDECWKSTDKRACVRNEYLRRIAELQARYRLVPATGPFSYACDDNSANEVTVMFFQTEPPTLIAEHGDSVSLMYLQPSASGTKYQGRNESFREHQGEARITWGYGAQEMQCKKVPQDD